MAKRRFVSGVSIVVAGGLFLASLQGCRNSDLPDVVPVTGTVTFQGQPVADATVVFFVNQGNLASGELSFGTTDAAGRFRLRTQVGRTEVLDGVAAGEHRVTISKLIPPQGMTEEAYQQKLDAEKAAGESGVYGEQREVVPPRVELLAAQYSNANQTTLTASVKKGEKNDFEFQLQ